MNEPTNPVVADLLAAGRRELNQHRVTDLRKPTPAVSTPGDLVAAARAFTQRTPLPGARGMIHRLADEIERLHAQLDRVRDALAEHPHCDKHTDTDPITCGWKYAVIGVRSALDTTDPTTQETTDGEDHRGE